MSRWDPPPLHTNPFSLSPPPSLSPSLPHSLRVERNGEWVTWTFEQYYADVTTAAKSLIKLGLERSHGVCILGFNSPEWFISYLSAIMVRNAGMREEGGREGGKEGGREGGRCWNERGREEEILYLYRQEVWLVEFTPLIIQVGQSVDAIYV